jgi:hypothetical protein
MRSWTLRMACQNEGEKNRVVGLSVEQKDETGTFTPLTIDVMSAGFMVFVYSIFTCQHLYMYTNAAERGLLLVTSTADIEPYNGHQNRLRLARHPLEEDCP